VAGAVGMSTIWDESSRREMRQRLARLRPDAPARWGRMTATQAVAHLADALRMAVGELRCTATRSPLRYPIVKQVVIYWVPMPKGAPTAQELVGRNPFSWGAEVADVEMLLDRLVRLPRTFAWPPHPLFGRLSRRAWGVVIYRHLDHHLRQFGV
jgi:hypothetical protein